MIFATIPPPPGQLIEVGPLSIHYYGVLIGIGALLAIALGRRRYAAIGGDPDLVDRVGFVSVIAGLLGGRGGYVITHASQFLDRPWAVLFLWEGGLAIFGGLTVGFAVGMWYARRLGMPVSAALDAIVPGIPLAQAIGRWGNYFNQELYGTPTNLPWALEVDPERRVAEYAQFETFHPTFLYESLLNLCLVAVLLWVGRQQRLRQGSIFWVYLAGYGFVRFWVELLRTDTAFRLLGLSRNNWIALLVFLGGLAGLRWWQLRGPQRAIGSPIDQPDAGVDADREAGDGDHAGGEPRGRADSRDDDTVHEDDAAPTAHAGRRTTAQDEVASHNSTT